MTSAGFTLIELVVTIALLAILVGLAVPSLRAFLANNQIASASSDFSTDLAVARAEAARRGVRVLLCASAAGTACDGGNFDAGWILFVDPDGDGSPTAADVLRTHAPLADDLQITTSDAAATVFFTPTGQHDAARTYTICRPEYFGRRITVGPTGRTSISATDATCS